jgi:hypothetical protein
LAGAAWFCCMPSDGVCSHTDTIRSGSLYGSGLNMIESTALKIAVLTPIPSANVTSAIAVAPGRFRKLLNPYRISANIEFMIRLIRG